MCRVNPEPYILNPTLNMEEDGLNLLFDVVRVPST